VKNLLLRIRCRATFFVYTENHVNIRRGNKYSQLAIDKYDHV